MSISHGPFADNEAERARFVLDKTWCGQAYLRDIEKFASGTLEDGKSGLAYVDARLAYSFKCEIYGCVALINPEYYLLHCSSKIRASHLEAARRAIRAEQRILRKRLTALV